MNIKGATIEIDGVLRISFSREELLATYRNVAEQHPDAFSLLMFLNKLEEILIKESST